MICVKFTVFGDLRPFGHPSQARTQVFVLQTCVDLRVRLARAKAWKFRRCIDYFPNKKWTQKYNVPKKKALIPEWAIVMGVVIRYAMQVISWQ